MEITKELKIQGISGSTVFNAPFQIVLEGDSFRRNEESSLTLDLDTCAYYNIPISFELVGRTLVCSFKSRELPLKNDGYVDMKSLKNDDLAIHSLKKSEEVVSPSFRMSLPSKNIEVLRTLELSSFGGGDGIHLSPLPCPFYRFVLDLTDEEFEECKALPPTSVFEASFRLLA